MSSSKSYIILPILILSLINSALAVSDENICDVQCQYCCREKQCRSEDECKGNFTPFVILGIVAGALVGLFILRKLYVYLKGKAPKRDPNRKRATRTRAKSPKPAKASKASKSKKPGKSNKEEKSQSRQEIYLQIDNESIVGVESNKPDEEREKKTSSKNDVTSKSRLEVDDKGKETNRSDKKLETSVPKPKNGTSKAADKDKEKDKGKDKGKDKEKDKRSTSASKKPAAGSKMTASSASAANKERGRSTNTSGKERSGSQKKGESSVGKDGKDGKDKMKSSTVSKK